MQFQKLKKQIDKVLNQLEDEVAKEGILITSPEFQKLLEEVKAKLLEEWGMTLDEYAIMELELDGKRAIEEDEVIKLGERTKELSEARKKETEQRMNELVQSFANKIQTMGSSLRGEIDINKKAILSQEDIRNIVKPMIPTIPQHTDFDHLNIIKDLNDLEKDINGVKDIMSQQVSHEDLVEVLPDQHHPEKHNLESHLKSELGNDLKKLTNGSNADKLHTHKQTGGTTRIFGGGGIDETHIRDMIDARHYVVGVGIAKITISATEPTDPVVGDLWIDTA